MTIMGGMNRPDDAHIPEYFRLYTDQAPDGDILETLSREIEETLGLVQGLDEERAEFRYAEGKWSIKELVGHLADTERIFAFRALCFARQDPTPLPGFDENEYAANSDCGERTLADLAEELRHLRTSNLSLFRGFSERAWDREGTANGQLFRTRTVPWILSGHELHHRKVLQEHYEL